MVSRNVMSQNVFCKTNKAFLLYLTTYFVSNPNPNNRIRVTRFLKRVISQLTTGIIMSSSNNIHHAARTKLLNVSVVRNGRCFPFDCFRAASITHGE